MIVPLVSPDGDAVIGRQPLIPTAGDQLLTPPLEKVHEIHIVGAVLLLIRKIHIDTHRCTSYLWRLPIL
ncbi:hypothetical protein SDC9_127388 [bioreactor metagenome]|uniref:Uncharacterized protein n=1 Tax=bioreactor metagenome TaxID=1076179 RepID=A0A645CTV3_9ZZZZ